MKLKTGYFFAFKLCKWLKSSAFLLLWFFIPGFQEAHSNVRPEILSREAFPTDIYGFTGSGTRNFSAKHDIPCSPFTGHETNKPKKQQSDSEKCFIQESFRVYADRGQDPALLVFSGIFTGYPNLSKSTIYGLLFVFISSTTGESSRIRPPPVI